VHNFAQENAKIFGKNIFCHTFVLLLLYRVKSNAQKQHISRNISTLRMFISIKFTEISIDKTNKIHQKVMG